MPAINVQSYYLKDGRTVEYRARPRIVTVEDSKGKKESKHSVSIDGAPPIFVLPVKGVPDAWMEEGYVARPPRAGDRCITSVGEEIIQDDQPLESAIRRGVYLVNLPAGFKWVTRSWAIPYWVTAPHVAH